MSEGRFDNPVVAALAGFKDLFARQELADKLTENDRFDGKKVLVTGANSGLGFALAVEIARRGGSVIMGGRSQIPQAGEKVKKLSGSEAVEMRYLDLSDIDSVDQFCEGLVRDRIHLDVTILNAGVALAKARKTASGLDEMFLVNYLSNVILTRQLLEKGVIVKHPEGTFRPRILFISSDSHQGSSAVDYEEFGTFYQYGPSKGISDYSYFKFLMNTYATELSRKVNENGRVDVGVNVICPGPVHSNIVKEAPWLIKVTLKAIFKVIFRSPAKAALPVVWMAITPELEGKTNEYMHMFREKKMDPKVYDPEEGKKLYERSLALWDQVKGR